MAAKGTEGPLGEWYEANPLRKFRRDSEQTIGAIATALDADNSMVGRWEIGTNQPKVETFVEMAKLMKLSAGDLFELWTVWLARRPAAELATATA